MRKRRERKEEMKNPDKSKNDSTVTRRGLLKAGVAAGVAAAGLAAPALAVAHGKVCPKKIRVEDIHITLNVIDPLSNPTSPGSVTFFLTLGNITQCNGHAATGTFYCRGCFTNPAALGLPALFTGTPALPAGGGVTFVDQRFRVDGLGQIYGSGDEGDFDAEGFIPLVVVGGSGAFRRARGTYIPDAGLPKPLDGGTINFTFKG